MAGSVTYALTGNRPMLGKRLQARSWHLVLGLSFGLILLPIGITGALLSTQVLVSAVSPLRQDLSALSLAAVLARMEKARMENHLTEVEALERSEDGTLIVSIREGYQLTRHYFSAASGELLGPVPSNSFYTAIERFHRSLLLAKPGRIIVALSALSLMLLTATGLRLTLRRQGGWRRLFSRPKEGGLSGLHTLMGQLALAPLFILSSTGLILALYRFELLPQSGPDRLIYPETPVELAPVPASSLAAFQDLPLSTLISLTFPIEGDWFDVYSVKTKQNYVFFDQFTGAALSEHPLNNGQRFMALMLTMHTGRGMVVYALLLGLMAMAVPAFFVTGLLLWCRRTSQSKAFAQDDDDGTADTVILVGSQSQSTWSFAQALQRSMLSLGHRVLLTDLDAIAPYPNAKLLFVLTSTFGDGQAPDNAQRFLQRIEQLPRSVAWHFAVLGFGDSQYDHFCRFADRVAEQLGTIAPILLPTMKIDRQHLPSFAHWGALLGQRLNQTVSLEAVTHNLKELSFTVLQQTVYRFEEHLAVDLLISSTAADKVGDKAGDFSPGDLLAVRVPGNEDSRERLYSIAANPHKGQFQLCIKLDRLGLCSPFLTALPVGAIFQARLQSNPRFHCPASDTPLVLIAAGTGVAPFIAMIQANRSRRPIELFFGCRHPDHDFLYGPELRQSLISGQLTALHTAFSRQQGKYVQDRLAEQTDRLVQHVRQGSIFMVCGGLAMAQAVAQQMDKLLTQQAECGMDMTLAQLKQQQRYLEEVY